jgi:tetraacyldisaccharide 4'-kinase
VNRLLYPFSVVYSFLSKTDRFFTKSKTLNKPVISVGNITWGGTGKTPVVIELLEFIIKQNMRPAVLTRGYGRKDGSPLLLKGGAEGADPSRSGDEPLLIARSVPEASVIAGARRYDNALKFEKEINPDVFVLDDGFQHWNIKRELDIVCINAANPFGNGMIIPAGILREPVKALERAGLVVITNSDMAGKAELEALQKKIYDSCGKEAVVAHYGACGFKRLDIKNDFDAGKLKDEGAYLLSGIGFSDGFKNSAQKAGVKIKGRFVLRDHKSYSREMMRGIFDKTGGAYLLTTAKDAVKIAFFADEKINEKIAVLAVKPVFETGKEQWEKTILKSLRHS